MPDCLALITMQLRDKTQLHCSGRGAIKPDGEIPCHTNFQLNDQTDRPRRTDRPFNIDLVDRVVFIIMEALCGNAVSLATLESTEKNYFIKVF